MRENLRTEYHENIHVRKDLAPSENRAENTSDTQKQEDGRSEKERERRKLDNQSRKCDNAKTQRQSR